MYPGTAELTAEGLCPHVVAVWTGGVFQKALAPQEVVSWLDALEPELRAFPPEDLVEECPWVEASAPEFEAERPPLVMGFRARAEDGLRCPFCQKSVLLPSSEGATTPDRGDCPHVAFLYDHDRKDFAVIDADTRRFLVQAQSRRVRSGTVAPVFDPAEVFEDCPHLSVLTDLSRPLEGSETDRSGITVGFRETR